MTESKWLHYTSASHLKGYTEINL